MTGGLGASTGVGGVAVGGGGCYYEHSMYRSPGEPCSMSSIAQLRLKAKQHSSGFSVGSYSPVSPSAARVSVNPGLSACQYATTDRT